MTDFYKRSQEELLELEFKNSKEYKKLEKGHIINRLVLFGAMIIALIFALFDPDVSFRFEVAILILWLVSGVIILDILERKRKKLFKQFKLAKF